MRRYIALTTVLLAVCSTVVSAQGFEPEPVFRVSLDANAETAVAGEPLGLAVTVRVDSDWHINSDQPGDEFSIPTTVEWTVPDGYDTPALIFPEGVKLSFDFSDTPIEVWEGKVVIPATLQVPAEASGELNLRVTVTAQACNDSQCLPPLPVKAKLTLAVAPPGSSSKSVNEELFRDTPQEAEGAASAAAGDSSGFEDKSLPLLLVLVFFGGLALNLTPCVFPLIPITVGFFTQQTKDRTGSAFPLALAYLLGMAITYSVLGIAASLFGMLFGGALQSPWVVGLIVAVLLALSTSMFGLWEMRIPGWAQRASGGRTGVVGALLMGLVVGFVAAPCIGPFVLGLVTFVGQKGDPFFGFLVFFVLSLGLGLPYLILGTFTGLLNKVPAAGMWMIGVRRVFGVVLVAMAAYFAAPLLPGDSGAWLMAGVLIAGGVYLLVVDRTGHGQPALDRVMRFLCAAMIVVGVTQLPQTGHHATEELDWQPYDPAAVAAAIASGQPVIVDFYADWCAPCRELDVKTFAHPDVARELGGYARFKVDQTRMDPVSSDAAMEFRVIGVPTVILYRDGKEVSRLNAFEPPEVFLKRLD